MKLAIGNYRYIFSAKHYFLSKFGYNECLPFSESLVGTLLTLLKCLKDS